MFDHEDDSSEESLSKQVLPIADDCSGPIDLNRLPATGEEYLRQVRYQASRLPDFRTAPDAQKHLSKSSPPKKHAWHRLFAANTTSSPSVPIEHDVPMDWQNEQCTSFSDIRDDYFQARDRLRKTDKNYKMAKLKSASHYWKFCFGPDIPFLTPLPPVEQDEQTLPTLPTITRMMTLNQPQLHELLQYEIEWLKECGCSTYLAMYTFATLVSIEKPISEDVVYTMRQACLAWKQVRLTLLNSRNAADATTVDPSMIKSSDLFVCIIGRYFGQFDLADSVE